MSNTAIFAGPGEGSRQFLVYRMALVTSTEVAMVLPLPVPPGVTEDAVRFIELSAYPEFFDDLALAFPQAMFRGALDGERRLSLGLDAPLTVHVVGSFEASFVPTRQDFSRLDRRFRLSDDVWQALPDYEAWGFAVFKLRPMSRDTEIHPMAFEFPRRNPSRLFFPTVHVHDGRVEPSATFDHVLYCQDVDQPRRERWSESFQPRSEWEESSVPVREVVDADRAKDIVRPDLPCYRIPLTGSYANVDVVI